MDVVWHSEALQELDEQVTWYEQRSRRIAERFQTDAECLAVQVGEHPMRYQLIGGPFRKAVLQGYPIAIVFEILLTHVFIIAVAHTSRDPNYWTSRVN